MFPGREKENCTMVKHASAFTQASDLAWNPQTRFCCQGTAERVSPASFEVKREEERFPPDHLKVMGVHRQKPMTLRLLFLIPAAYLFGSIPFSHLITRWRTGLAIRSVGEGNVGSRNVWHVVGPRWGALEPCV